jgi:hypothetical protein
MVDMAAHYGWQAPHIRRHSVGLIDAAKASLTIIWLPITGG